MRFRVARVRETSKSGKIFIPVRKNDSPEERSFSRRTDLQIVFLTLEKRVK